MKAVKTLILTVITLFLFSAFSSEANAWPWVRVYTDVPVVKTVNQGPKYVCVAGYWKINKHGKKVWVPGHWKKV